MGRLSQTIQSVSQPAEEPQRIFDAEIEVSANAPGDEVWVTVEDLDDGVHKHGPVEWGPEPSVAGLHYPKKGQKCLVARSESNNTLWIIAINVSGPPDKKWSEL